MAPLWNKAAAHTPDALWQEVVSAIEQAMGHGADHAAIRPAAYLGADLALTSIAVARLVGILQNRFRRTPLPFPTLFVTADGSVLRDIRVQDLVAFLRRHIRGEEP